MNNSRSETVGANPLPNGRVGSLNDDHIDLPRYGVVKLTEKQTSACVARRDATYIQTHGLVESVPLESLGKEVSL